MKYSIFLCVMLSCMMLSTATAQVRKPEGVFMFRPGEGRINLNVPAAHNPNIDGYVLRDKWENMQPDPSRPPDFSRLVNAARIATAQGKKYQIEVFGGTSIPGWAGSVNTQFSPGTQAKLLKLCRQFAAVFANDPNLVAVHCTLPMTDSPEFKLAGTTLKRPGWQSKALDANAKALNELKADFPNVTIVIDIHNPDSAADGFVAAQIAQAVEILGPQLAIQENAWNAKPEHAHYNLYQDVKSFSAMGGQAGLEQLDRSSAPRYGGSFERSVQSYAVGVANYLIIYEPDDAKVIQPWRNKGTPPRAEKPNTPMGAKPWK